MCIIFIFFCIELQILHEINFYIDTKAKMNHKHHGELSRIVFQ